MIAFFCSDLLWSSRIGGTAKDLGITAARAASEDDLLCHLKRDDFHGLLVELDGSAVPFDLISAAREAESRSQSLIRVIAFGPHVDEAGFAKATESGADRVLPRGAIAQQIADLLRWLDAPAD